MINKTGENQMTNIVKWNVPSKRNRSIYHTSSIWNDTIYSHYLQKINDSWVMKTYRVNENGKRENCLGINLFPYKTSITNDDLNPKNLLNITPDWAFPKNSIQINSYIEKECA